MSNVFKKFMSVGKKPNRYAFDLSFNNNFTTQFGRLTPVFCQEVNPGDSVRINPTFGLNFAPFVYPVQTKIKAHLHFFYVRNRALWKDWMDFIGNTKEDLIPPYLDFSLNKHLLKDGSLADYFGLPTSYVTPTGLDVVSLPPLNNFKRNILLDVDFVDNYGSVRNVTYEDKEQSEESFITSTILTNEMFTGDRQVDDNLGLHLLRIYPFTPTNEKDKPANAGLKQNSITIQTDASIDNYKVRVVGAAYANGPLTGSVPNGVKFDSSIYINSEVYINGGIGYLNLTEAQADWFTNIRYGQPNSANVILDRYVYIILDIRGVDLGSAESVGNVASVNIPYIGGVNEIKSAEDNRFYLDNLQPISALPFRAYDAIYNSFYRNPQNNPLIIDGTPEYNKYVKNTDGGKDTTVYNFYNRNWDDDCFTTAVQSPQQGYAPLVGVTSYGLMTFSDENGTYEAQANVAADGDTIDSISIKSPDMPTTTARALVDMVSSGITISDFRNVNALQRWLEKNMRRGLRYKDQMLTHFGSEVKYDELLMPEFIGGLSQSVDVNRVINQTASEQSPLGSFAGLGQAFGGTNNNITHYADEHGFIIGILSVVPYAVYSQTLPRMFTRFNALDYFFPEFNHVGMQPIYNKDIAPLQVVDSYRGLPTESLKKVLNGVFGYNRPYFDYVSKLDECHGNFRNNYRDYLLHRVFSGVPYLSPDFLTVSENDLNQVFSVVDDEEQLGYSDKIVGLIHFDYTKKTSVSEFAQPRLEN